MELELHARLSGTKLKKRQESLQKAALTPDAATEQTALLWDGEELIATGSRQGNLLKCIAVDPTRQGEGLTATLLTALRQDALKAGHRHLFLYTKPMNQYLFSSLFFYPIARTQDVLLMEDREKAGEVQCLLDIEIFAKYFVPRFSINRRYVAEEPLSPMTAQYNEALKTHLPQKGIVLREIPRLEKEGTPISASAVRAHLDANEWDKIKKIAPITTYNYLKGELPQ